MVDWLLEDLAFVVSCLFRGDELYRVWEETVPKGDGSGVGVSNDKEVGLFVEGYDGVVLGGGIIGDLGKGFSLDVEGVDDIGGVLVGLAEEVWFPINFVEVEFRLHS